MDYFISSPNIIPFISDFHVYGFSSILSDVHCPVALQLIINDSNTKNELTTDSYVEKIKLWDENKKDCLL